MSRNAFSAVLEILHLFYHPKTAEDFSKLLGLQYYFPENFRCNLTFYKVTIFLLPLFIAFLNRKILGFLFLRKITKPGE